MFGSGNLMNLAKQAKPLSAVRALLAQDVQDDLAQIPVNTQGIADIVASIGVANGITPLDAASKIPVQFMPSIAIGDTHTVADQSEMLDLVNSVDGGVQKGDVAVIVGVGNYRLQGADATDAASWIKLVDNEGVESILIDGVAETGQVNLAKIAASGLAVDAGFAATGFAALNAKDAIVEVAGRVSDEAAARLAADNLISQSVVDEAQTRGQADNVLTMAVAERVKLADYKVSQPVAGTIDGTNKVFQLPEAFSAGSLRLWMNNAALHPDQYTVGGDDGLQVEFIGSPDPGDAMRCDYIKAAA